MSARLKTQDFQLRLSRYLHVMPLSGGHYLCVHPFTSKRIVANSALYTVLAQFKKPCLKSKAFASLKKKLNTNTKTIEECLNAFIENGFLFHGSPAQELKKFKKELSGFFGSNPEQKLEEWVHKNRSGQEEYSAATGTHTLSSFSKKRHSLSIIMLGRCEVHIETDYLRRLASDAGIDLEIVTTHLEDATIVKDRKHDAVVIGALDERYAVLAHDLATQTGRPHDVYLKKAAELLSSVRELTDAPILINNLPVPTLSPTGMAEQGQDAYRNRIRNLNSALSGLAQEFKNVHTIDLDSALSWHGKRRLLDDSFFTFGHLGSSSGLQQDKADGKALQEAFGHASAHEFEKVLAQEHLSTLITLFGFGRKKCVIIAPDYALWPERLRNKELPFPDNGDDLGLDSRTGPYVALHEALRALAKRGVLLACIVKGNASALERAWKYPQKKSTPALLEPKDFTSTRMNEKSTSENIKSILSELRLKPDEVIYVDCDAQSRTLVQNEFSDIRTLGENRFLIRSELLMTPELQRPQPVENVKTTIERERLKAGATDKGVFLRSLAIECAIQKLKTGDSVDKLQELLTQSERFKTTERIFRNKDLVAFLEGQQNRIYALQVKDRLTNFGFVGACLVSGNEIVQFVLDCRVTGLGVESVLLRAALLDLAQYHRSATGRFVSNSRNASARNLFKEAGFSEKSKGTWVLTLDKTVAKQKDSSYYKVSLL